MKDLTIGLLTDFGLDDTYVGVMKGVIAGLAPRVRVIDVTHSLPPGDVRQAAFKLWQCVPYFPHGTVFLAVVDPGVGTSRRAVAAAWDHFTVVAPDNGLLTYLLAEAPPRAAVELTRAEYQRPRVSSTFHGRDIFAPAAAHLARGLRLDRLGPPVHDLVRFEWPRLELLEGPQVKGELLHADHFGNWITSLGRMTEADGDLELQPWLPSCPPARLQLFPRLRLLLPTGLELPILRTFGESAEGTVLAYIGSEGLLEIGVNRGSAAAMLPLQTGQDVLLTYEGRSPSRSIPKGRGPTPGGRRPGRS